MSRTVHDVPVIGRTVEEVRNEIFFWIKAKKMKLMEDRVVHMKARKGHPLGFTAPKYIEIQLWQHQDVITVHLEGYIGVFGGPEMEFAPSEVLGYLPRKQGWELFNDLCGRMFALSGRGPSHP